ncbi:MAG: PorT family protein [Candidatus Saccharicenans sp.]|nr:PorT family protein [Candidatus Saccharicenans sp.]
MKKIFTSVLIALFLCLVAGQTVAQAGIQFGIRGGGNAAKLTGADVQDLEGTIKNKVGLVAGIFLAINIGKIVTIQPEVLYTMKGSQINDPLGEYTGKLYGDYVEIPLLLKIRIPTPGIQPAIFAGPSVGFKLKEKLQIDGQDVPLEESLLENNDYGAIFGAGLDFGRHFMIDVRYSLGLKKVLTAIDEGIQPDVKNGVWSATVGIAF